MMRPTLWLVVVLLFSLGLVTSAKSYTPYIIGGKTAKVGAWPWMASIRTPVRGENTHICGGALIKPSIVLTSALCAIRLNLLESDVVLGLHDQEDGSIGKPEAIKLDSFVIHEDWTPRERYADLAILKLARPASNNSFIKPIALLGKGYDLTGKVCTVAGWGLADDEGLGTELQQKDLIVWTDLACRRWWEDRTDKSRICASSADGELPSGVCMLDTGGPFSCPVEGGYALGGIALYFKPSCVGRGPGVFTDIPSFKDWINKNSA